MGTGRPRNIPGNTLRALREVHLPPGAVLRSVPDDGRLQFVLIVAMCYGSTLGQTLRVRGFLPCAHPGAGSDISRLKEEPSEYVTFDQNWNTTCLYIAFSFFCVQNSNIQDI
jgi:hypothetical protein